MPTVTEKPAAKNAAGLLFQFRSLVMLFVKCLAYFIFTCFTGSKRSFSIDTKLISNRDQFIKS